MSTHHSSSPSQKASKSPVSISPTSNKSKGASCKPNSSVAPGAHPKTSNSPSAGKGNAKSTPTKTSTLPTLRKAAPKDASTIAALAAKSTRAQFFNSGLTVSGATIQNCVDGWNKKRVQKLLTDSKNVTIAAQSSTGELMGFATLDFGAECPSPSVSTKDAKKSVSLDALYVDPSVHRAGHRTRLLEEAIRVAKQNGVELMWLLVFDGNVAARSLYSKHGFDIIGDTGMAGYEDVINDFIMARTL